MPSVKGGTLNYSATIRIVDSADGTPETGVTSATAGLALFYRRAAAAVVALTESDLSALTDAHSDGGMLHISDGYYRIDIPDAAVAAGVPDVLVAGTVTGMVVIGTLVEIDPAADIVAVSGDQTAADNLESDYDGTGYNKSASEIATVAALTGHTAQTGDSYARLGNPAEASIAADLLVIDNFVDELESRLTAARAGYLDELAAANIPTDLSTIDTVVDAIKAVTDLLPNAGLLSDLATILTDTNELQVDWTNGGRLDLIIDAILADTGTDGVVLAADAITSAKIAASGGNLIADHVIRRSFVNAADSADGDTKSFRSLLGAIAKQVNKVAVVGSTLTAYEEDDTTSLGTQTVSSDSAADPITAVDTNG